MTARAEITAAADRLAQQLAAATAEPWRPAPIAPGAIFGPAGAGAQGTVVCIAEGLSPADLELVLTLRRMARPMLSMLRDVVAEYGPHEDLQDSDPSAGRLVRAILDTPPPEEVSTSGERQEWVHADGTPCEVFLSDRPRPRGEEFWWCTEHQQHVHHVDTDTAPPGEEDRHG